jgi:hypothetical protein
LTGGGVATRTYKAAAEFVRLRMRGSDPDGRTPLPVRPSSRADVPEAAWSALEAACGEPVLERLLIVPTTWRPSGKGRRLVLQKRVIAFGPDAIGEWTEGEGVAASLPIADLLAFDDRIVLLHGELTLVGRTGRLAVQYNAVARPLLRESILWLRRRILGGGFPTESRFVWIGASGEERPAAELPYKWSYLLSERDDLRVDPEGPEMIAVGDVAELGVRRPGPASGLAILGPRELIVASEPPVRPGAPRYGVDLTVVPRRYLARVGWSRGNLAVGLRADGAAEPPSIVRPLDERLFEAMRRSFGDAVEWA